MAKRNEESEYISERAGALHSQIVTPQVQTTTPPPEIIEAVRQYYVLQAEEMKQRVSDIERLLGFMQSADDLAVRLARLESFVLPKG